MYFSFEMQMGEIFKGFKEKLLHPPGEKSTVFILMYLIL